MTPKNSMRAYYALAAVIFAVWVFTPIAQVQSEESFFKDKTIKFIAASSPGGGTDTLVRLHARHFSKHIPGNPRIIVVNMSGAAGLRAANYMWNRAPRDGLTISSMASGLVYRHATGDPAVKYTLDKFNWLGSVANEPNVIYLRGDSPYTSFEAIRKASRKPKMGAQSKSHTSNVTLQVVQRVFPGVKFDVVVGYPGTAEILLDIERGALDGRAHSAGSFMSTRSDWIKTGFVKILAVGAPVRDRRLPNVPTLKELAPPEKRKLLEGLYVVGQRSYALPPGVPPERVKILRDAYAALHKDENFLQEGKKMGWNIEFANGEDLNRDYSNLINDQDVMALFRDILK